MMLFPALVALGLLVSLAASTPVAPLLDRSGQSYPQCRRDACLNAVLAHNQKPQYEAYNDCVAYQRTTTTPCAVTVTAGYNPIVTRTCATGTVTVTKTCTSSYDAVTTETHTAYSTTYLAVATSTVFEDAANIAVNKRSAAKSQIPRYAKDACKATGYTSACKCIGAPTETYHASTPTTTVTNTQTVCATATKGTVVITQTVSVTNTRTGQTTVTVPTTIPTTSTVTVTTTSTNTAPTGAPVFILYDRNDPVTRMISVPAGSGGGRVQVGTTPATRWYLGSDGSLRSIANDGNPTGTSYFTQFPYVTVADDANSQIILPLTCSVRTGANGLNQTGELVCAKQDDVQRFLGCGSDVIAISASRTNLTDAVCDGYTEVALTYQVVQLGIPAGLPTGAPVSSVQTRTEERGYARNRRKRRPLAEMAPYEVPRAVITPQHVPRAVESE